MEDTGRDYINMDLHEMRLQGIDWIHLA